MARRHRSMASLRGSEAIARCVRHGSCLEVASAKSTTCRPSRATFFMDRQPLKPASIVQTSFVPSETVKQLVASAETYSGEEKRGVHEIAKRNSSVIDLEIAFTKTGEDGKRSSPRIDLGALQVVGEGDASLTFYEAKLASDVRLASWSRVPTRSQSRLQIRH